VAESSKRSIHPTPEISVTTERNKLMSWDSAVQKLTKSGAVIPSLETSITLVQLGSIQKIIKLVITTLVKLPYTVFKLGYEIAKFVTVALSKVRRFLFGAQ
jgi:hypothetical protein